MTAEQTATKRPRTRRTYVLQHDNDGDWEFVAEVADKATGRKHVRDGGFTGAFRTIAIVDEFTATAEQKTVVKLS